MIGNLVAVVLDAAEHRALAAFYRDLTGWPLSPAAPPSRPDAGGRAALDAGDGWTVGFQHAPDHRPPRWPGQERPQQAHLDLRVPDLEPALRRAESLGGTLLRRNDRWLTVADPAGHPFDLCWQPGAPGVQLLGPVLDCPDPLLLSFFYTALLGKPLTYSDDDNAMIGEPGTRPVLFQRVAGYAPPRWPDPAHPRQLHLDVTADDLDEAERAALSLGATTAAAGPSCRVLLDPAGKPFYLHKAR
ncbi:VOC family protein [Dactylosporangium aurantiacum]|uniref:VOC family protein n=1 Tax=Dactylosporangium aurantiacum TaxID=35754 RepID=A0A9Q9IPT2_9ACTN|nr:VOC family protein [Dactylosporangium aurantiacum]MDG6105567.1 VOC family protein [Dactylosporangium aurantiacum]UWZ57090.1 VOC family protein [Dactylosporangium aurantiacum]